MTIKDEWDQADCENKEAKEAAYWILKVCPQCQGELVGHWTDKDGKGILCWMFHCTSEPIEMEWPEKLTCRVCQVVETREEVRKRAFTPYHFSGKDASHSCGRHNEIDSSD